jgi:hypothetical protein
LHTTHRWRYRSELWISDGSTCGQTLYGDGVFESGDCAATGCGVRGYTAALGVLTDRPSGPLPDLGPRRPRRAQTERARKVVSGAGTELFNSGAVFQFRRERRNGQENVRQEDAKEEDGILKRRWIGEPPFTRGRVEEEEAYCQGTEAGRRVQRRSREHDTPVYYFRPWPSTEFLGPLGGFSCGE